MLQKVLHGEMAALPGSALWLPGCVEIDQDAPFLEDQRTAPYQPGPLARAGMVPRLRRSGNKPLAPDSWPLRSTKHATRIPSPGLWAQTTLGRSRNLRCASHTRPAPFARPPHTLFHAHSTLHPPSVRWYKCVTGGRTPRPPFCWEIGTQPKHTIFAFTYQAAQANHTPGANRCAGFVRRLLLARREPAARQ